MWHLLPSCKETAEYHRSRHSDILAACKQWQSEGTAIHAGFTYWGQFLAHEVGPRPGLEPHRTGALDLDSIYGDGVARDGEYLLLLTRKNNRPIDLPRKGNAPLIADVRNDENLLVAQFHLLITRLHNALASRLAASEKDSAQIYAAAQRSTIRVVHHTLQEHYLAKLLWPKVYDFLFRDNDTLFKGPFCAAGKTELPAEVTLAALRFGHSMIRDSYGFSAQHPEVSLGTLFQLTGHGGLSDSNPLPEDYAVNWSHFFSNGNPNTPTNGAQPIDPFVTPAMTTFHDIVDKNLQQGYDAELPSGQQAVAAILAARPELASLGLTSKPMPSRGADTNMPLLQRAGIADCTPFWLFTLLDATQPGSGGRNLGPFGSLFVGSALKWSMETAEERIPNLPSISEVEKLAQGKLHTIQHVTQFILKEEGEAA